MRILFALAVASVAALAAPDARAQSKQDFTLVNATGYVISHLYVSPSKQDDWGSDILGKSTLDEDESADITFSRAEKTCDWDLKVTYEDDNSSVVWRGIDLCKVSKITIRYNRKNDATSASFD
jgi:hypothetical protein